MSFLNLISNNKQNIHGVINFNIKIVLNYDTYSMHDFRIKIIIYYLLFLTVVEYNRVVSLPSIIGEKSSGDTAYTGPNLRPIPILESWDSLPQRCCYSPLKAHLTNQPLIGHQGGVFFIIPSKGKTVNVRNIREENYSEDPLTFSSM